jgi:NADPH-dependent dioxygenase
LVVGAGPTGLSVAIELAAAGVDVQVVDALPAPSAESRAMGVHTRTLELLDLHGLGDSVVRAGNSLQSIAIYAGERCVGRVAHAAVPSRFACALIVSQAQTEAQLRDRLASLGVRVEWGTKLRGLQASSGGVCAELERQDGAPLETRAEWLVGCDGAHSTVRSLLALQFDGDACDEGWAVMDARVQWDLPSDQGYVFMRPDSYTIVLPQRDGLHRVMLSGRAHELDSAPVSLDEMQQYLRERCPFPNSLCEPGWSSPFKIQRRQVSGYRAGRALLAGDAAHVHSPSGGQGLNTGVQDAFNLGWKLALVARGVADEDLLDTYEAERQPVATEILRMTDAFQRQTDRFAAREGSELSVSGVATNYRDGPLSLDLGDTDMAVRAGDRVGDAVLRDGSGATSRAYELLRDRSFAAVFAAPPTADGRRAAFTAAAQVAARFHSVLATWVLDERTTSRLHRPTRCKVLTDVKCELRAALGLGDGGFALIRPDAYIAVRGRAIEYATSVLTRYLSETLGIHHAGNGRVVWSTS